MRQEERKTAQTEGRTRRYTGALGAWLPWMLAAWAVFQLWAAGTGALGAVKLRTVHVTALLPFAFLLYPARKAEPRERRGVPPVDAVLCMLSLLALGYMLLRQDALARTGRLGEMDVWVGALCLLLAFEAARRASGPLAAIALLFFSYFAWWGQYVPGAFGTAAFSWKRVVKALAWDSTGILGTGVGVSSTYIFVFVVFGAFLKACGFSQLINDLALALVGRSPGGPAKVSVIASALMGMINGSAVANVATTGTVTIPLMKRTGYSADFAGAVEAAASTGGQFTPPIMGAVGFVMAEFMGVPYTQVMLAAAVPAALYYLGLLWAVHLEARRLGLKGLSREHLPQALQVLKRRGYLLLPPLFLIVLMLLGFTPLFSAIVAMALIVPVSFLGKEGRMTPRRLLDALAEGAQSAVGVGVSCVIIGVIIGSVNMTGLGVNFGHQVLRWAGQGQLALAGLMVMGMSLILGMGVPGVAAYVIVYAVAVPVLKSAGATDMAANLFCLMYACLSNITPPVALSAYVASGIAGGSMGKTGLQAMRLGAAGFVAPFFFLLHPVLLGSGGAFGAFLYALLTACLGVMALGAGLSGRRAGEGRLASWLKRLPLLCAGMLLMSADVLTDAAGALLLAACGAYAFWKRGREKPAQQEEQL